MKIKHKTFGPTRVLRRPLWVLPGSRLCTHSMEFTFQMRFSPTNLKGKWQSNTKQSHSPAPKFWRSASTINNFQSTSLGWTSQTFSPSSCSSILIKAFILKHLNSWYELGRQGIRQQRRKNCSGLWGSKVSVLRVLNYSMGKGRDQGGNWHLQGICTIQSHLIIYHFIHYLLQKYLQSTFPECPHWIQSFALLHLIATTLWCRSYCYHFFNRENKVP